MARIWMRNGVILLALATMLAGTAGCGWMGRTAGKAQAKVERGVDAMNQGYKDGYEKEQSKDAPKNGSGEQGTGTGKQDAETI